MEEIFGVIVFVILLTITFFKRRGQLGKTWCGPQSAAVTIKDKELSCTHCGHNRFKKREGFVTTSFVTLFNLEFWNRSARCFVCEDCGLVHWFIADEEKAQIEHSDKY